MNGVLNNVSSDVRVVLKHLSMEQKRRVDEVLILKVVIPRDSCIFQILTIEKLAARNVLCVSRALNEFNSSAMSERNVKKIERIESKQMMKKIWKYSMKNRKLGEERMLKEEKKRKKKILKILSAPANDKYFIADVKFHLQHFPSMFSWAPRHTRSRASAFLIGAVCLFRMSIE